MLGVIVCHWSQAVLSSPGHQDVVPHVVQDNPRRHLPNPGILTLMPLLQISSPFHSQLACPNFSTMAMMMMMRGNLRLMAKNLGFWYEIMDAVAAKSAAQTVA